MRLDVWENKVLRGWVCYKTYKTYIKCLMLINLSHILSLLSFRHLKTLMKNLALHLIIQSRC